MTGIADKAALLEYYRAFKVQADNILDLAPSEVSELFMRRLPRVVEEKLRERLCINSKTCMNQQSGCTRAGWALEGRF